jgi:putative oxidoreductase
MQATPETYPRDVAAARPVVRPSVETWAPLIGRILIAAIFVVSGLAKVTDFDGTVGHMRAAGLPATEALAAVAAVLELGCALALLVGAWARPAGLLLALYLIPVTLVFHAFWNYTGMEQRMQLINFLKNLAIMGGLTYVATYGPGLFALDARWRRRAALQPRSVRPFGRVPIGT